MQKTKTRNTPRFVGITTLKTDAERNTSVHLYTSTRKTLKKWCVCMSSAGQNHRHSLLRTYMAELFMKVVFLDNHSFESSGQLMTDKDAGMLTEYEDNW